MPPIGRPTAPKPRASICVMDMLADSSKAPSTLAVKGAGSGCTNGLLEWAGKGPAESVDGLPSLGWDDGQMKTRPAHPS